MPRDESVIASLPPTPLPLPTLHICGASDTFVPMERTYALAARFVNAEFFEHEGGHGIPTGAEFRARLKGFVARQTA